MREPKSATDLLTFRLLRLTNTFGLYNNRRYRKELNVTLPEWRVLSIVALQGTTTAGDVSRAIATDKAWVGLTVEKLRRRGYVRGSADKLDKRRTLVSLTKAGQAVYEEIMGNARRRQKRLLDTLPEGSVEILFACIDRLQTEADLMLEELEELEAL
jgi:DNA-binding MarR family transcriptional regulator